MNRPLVYFTVSLFMGCLSSVLIADNLILDAVLTASFLALIYFTINRKYFLLCALFFCIGILSNIVYFNVQVRNSDIKIRIEDKKENYAIANYKGRKMYLSGDISKLTKGENYIVEGNFKGKRNYSSGILGYFAVKSFRNSNNDIVSLSYKLKDQLYDKFFHLLGKEKAALVMSLCYGEAEYLTEEQNIQFKELGVIHAISVSGFHMALIYKVLENIFGIYISMIISFVYVLFTGSKAATLRAFIMIFIMKISKKIYKKYDSLSSLCFSAILLLLYKPYFVLDLGFLLSYLACLGIILYYNKLRRLLFRLPKNIGESLSITISAQVFSMPFAALYFKQTAYGFILGNMVLLPLYSIIVLVGNGALLILMLNKLFIIITILLKITLTAVSGATFILLKLTPTVINTTITDTLAVIIMFFCYVLQKHGYKRWRHFPIFLIPVLLFQYYIMFTEVQYFNLGVKECVLISKGTKSVLLESSKDKSVFKDISADKVLDCNGVKVKLTNNIDIFTPMFENNDNRLNSIDLGLRTYNKKIIFTRDISKYESLSQEEYDIIKLPKKVYYNNQKNSYNNKLSSIKYIIIFNKVYNISGL